MATCLPSYTETQRLRGRIWGDRDGMPGMKGGNEASMACVRSCGVVVVVGWPQFPPANCYAAQARYYAQDLHCRCHPSPLHGLRSLPAVVSDEK